MKNTIKSHRLYDEEDYKALSTKGYSDDEIIKIWNKSVSDVLFGHLLWLDAHDPESVKCLLTEFKKVKKNNPFNPKHNE